MSVKGVKGSQWTRLRSDVIGKNPKFGPKWVASYQSENGYRKGFEGEEFENEALSNRFQR